MKKISVFTDKIKFLNDRFWAASGSDELYAMAYSPEGEFLMKRMDSLGTCRYVRNHYTFNHEIRSGVRCGGDVYSENENGESVYDFTWINGVYRKFVENGIKPIVELDFLPDKLASLSGDVTQEGTGEKYNNRFYPNDWEKWTALLKAFVRNLADEFGLEEIRTWYFEVWNEPDSWPLESWSMFYKMYDIFVDAVTSVDEKLRVGGPGCFTQQFMFSFLDHVANGTNYVTGEKGTRIDFISYHIYGMSGADNWLGSYPLISPTVQRFSQDLMWVFERMVGRYPSLKNVEFHLNEWGVISNYDKSSSVFPPLEVRNSEYSALFMIKLADTILELRRSFNLNLTMMLYWGFAGEDFFGKMFNGNRSLTTKCNICKPIQTAHEFMSLLGSNFVETDLKTGGDEGCIAAADENGAQALVYSFNEFDAERKLPDREYNVEFSGLADGKYTLKVYTMDDAHNNTFRLWERMGRPEAPDAEQLNALYWEQNISADTEFEVEVRNGKFSYSITVPSVSMKLISLEAI